MEWNKKLGLSQKDINQLLSTYRLQKNEFRRIEGFQEESYESIRLKGFVISLSEETSHGEKTGRIIATHTRSDGRISLQDVLERDENGQLQFQFRNLDNAPPADREYIRDLEEENKQLREAGQQLQNKLQKLNTENPMDFQKLELECQDLRKELEISHKLINEYRKELDKVKAEHGELPKHNARGAGRKPSKERANAIEKCRLLLSQGKSRKEIQEELSISAATFYRYKSSMNI